MADIKALITTVVTPLVQYPDDIKVDFKETTRYLEYNLTVNPEDIGRVIGRQGRVASAIRTIVYSVEFQDLNVSGLRSKTDNKNS